LLARIDEVTATSRTIMAGDLSGRVPVYGSGDELDRLSENLNAMLERIEQLMTGLQEVSDNIAHDLKTPLNRLRNRVEAALRQADGEAVYRDALERTIEEADDLIKTFNALLSIARLEAGAVRETMADIDVGALVHGVAELYEPAAEDQGLVLQSRVTKSLHVAGDRQLLGQAVANLIDNAIKYGFSASGAKKTTRGARGAIHVTGRRRANRVEISVADNGTGIPEAERERVLKRFVRLEEARSRPGSGLGLSLVAAVARLHGGTLRLEDNKPGLKAVLSLPSNALADEAGNAS
jgi:signal transduction histidine kinase